MPGWIDGALFKLPVGTGSKTQCSIACSVNAGSEHIDFTAVQQNL